MTALLSVLIATFILIGGLALAVLVTAGSWRWLRRSIEPPEPPTDAVVVTDVFVGSLGPRAVRKERD